MRNRRKKAKIARNLVKYKRIHTVKKTDSLQDQKNVSAIKDEEREIAMERAREWGKNLYAMHLNVGMHPSYNI